MQFGEKVVAAVLAGSSLVGLGLGNTRSAVGQEKVIHHFTGTDGSAPDTSLYVDAKGDLFGTTTSGGSYGKGAAFEMIPVAGGGWTEKVIYNFQTYPDLARTALRR